MPPITEFAHENPAFGVSCVLCGEEADDTPTHPTMAYTASGGFEPRWMHADCALRDVLGGIGHLIDHRYWCRIMGDPDAGRTYRQSAREVYAWVREHGTDAATRAAAER